MKSFFSAFQLPVATATGGGLTVPLAAAFPAVTPFISQSTSSKPAVQQAHKARKMASLATHRAQVLAQRRTSIPASAKRW
ncbi:hypothetical protein [Hymenobacter sp.]|uniref:hypothetical protein n=1 Tax=Hymenobacter sp. TaxID=1898978 RepID=UPI002EDB4276